MDKWQQREVAEHARNNNVTEAEALAELYPEAVPAGRKVSPRKTAEAPKE